MGQIHGKQLKNDSVLLAKLNDAGSQGTILFGAGTKIGITDAPTSNTDLANKAYVDSLATGLDPKASVRVATTAVLSGTMIADNGTPATGERAYNTTAKTITWFATQGPTTIDGVTLANGNRILVKNETATSGPSAGEGRIYNGIYERTSQDVWTRASDQDGTPSNEVSGGNYTFVEVGSTEINKGYVLQGDGILTLQTDNLIWVQFSSVAALTGGAGIAISSNEINVELDTVSGLEFDTGGAAGKLRVNSDNTTGAAVAPVSVTANGVGVSIDNSTITHSAGILSVDVTSASFVEGAQDAVGAMVTDSGSINFTYTDGTPSLTAVVTPDSTTGATVAPVAVGANGVGVTVDNSTIIHTAGTLSVVATAAAFVESAQDAVGTILADTATIDFTYTDGTPEITAIVKTNSISESHLTASVAGTGISGGNGTPLSVDYSTAGASGAAIEASSLASTANGLGASLVGYEANNYSGTDVQMVLDEIYGYLNTPYTGNKEMVANVTTADFQAATATTLAVDPANLVSLAASGSYIQVFVNGIKVTLGSGVKTKDCYFSGDGGTTAKTYATMAGGDTLYWVGSVAGYQLDATDRIDFDYCFNPA